MDINALLMDERDNVATCVVPVAKGQKVVYKKGDETAAVEAAEDIPYCHKVAVTDIKKGGQVTKYGEMIGEADTDIHVGCWVSHLNIHSVPRDYDSELV